MLWFWISLVLCVVLLALNLRKQHQRTLRLRQQQTQGQMQNTVQNTVQNTAHKQARTHTQSAVHNEDEWQQIIRDVQRHMHMLCVYREAIRGRLQAEVSIMLSSMEERLVCEIADHMTLVNRAHRLLNEAQDARKQTDPALIFKSMRQRCVDSENLCRYIADELHLYLSVAALNEVPDSEQVVDLALKPASDSAPDQQH